MHATRSSTSGPSGAFDERNTPLAASDGSEPEPDLAVVPPGDYDEAHPTTAHLVIEVSRSSLERDAGLEARLSPERGIPEYGAVDLARELITVRTEVVRGAYVRKTPYRRGESVPLPLAAGAQAKVDDILPARERSKSAARAEARHRGVVLLRRALR